MSCVVFETPGLIDLRSFTLMGVSAKPNSTNPLGKFGTGLKYSVATLVRLGATFIVWIGEDKYTFFKRDDKEFRGQPVEKLSMRRESFRLTKPRVTDLPYTVGYGKNWKPWMCYRELESNTRDENGTTWHDTAPAEMIVGKADTTRIVIDLPEFEKAFVDRADIFLPDAQKEGRGVQVIDKPSKFIYWRGLKVYELQKDSQFTYNFLDPLELTEDRTLTHVWYARQRLADWLVQHDDEARIEQVVKVGDKYWEHGLEPAQSTAPSRAYHNVMVRSKHVGGGFYTHYQKWDERVSEHTFELLKTHKLPWRRVQNTIVDAQGVTILEAPYSYVGKWDLTADQLLDKINPAEITEEPEHDDDDDGAERDTDGVGEAGERGGDGG